MKTFAQVSLKRKLLIVFMSTAIVALLLACTAFVLNDIRLLKKISQAALAGQAQLLGNNSTAALRFQDPEAGQETLSSLKLQSEYLIGALYDEKGNLFASYKNTDAHTVPPHRNLIDLDNLSYNYLAVHHTIIHHSQPIGSIYLLSNISSLRSAFIGYISIAGLVFLVSLLVAFMLSTTLQRIISEPILRLATVARQVSKEKDYSLRIQKTSQDEVGTLIDRFNEMLAYIEERDSDLAKHQEHLEDLVLERTNELSATNSQLKEEVKVRAQAEQLVAQSARDLAKKNLELAEARDNALEAARLKANFLATMSHEIRTPMNGILGFTGILLDSDLTNAQRDSAETVRASAENLLTIINDILDYSKIEAGKLSLNRMDFDLQVTLEDVLELLGTQASAKNIELVGLIDPNLRTWLHGDPQRLRQILLNLVGNGIKFTESGEVTVHVTKVSQKDKAVQIRFEIRDTGVGIPSDVQSLLFQPFSQVDSSSTRRHGGTGLGLAICKQLTELMEGTIGVESQPGNGSLFWFVIKLEEGTLTNPPEVIPRANLQGLRICCVDDNDTNRKLIQQYSKEWGMQFLESNNSTNTVSLLEQSFEKEKPCDLIILDWQMPTMDGLTLAKHIRNHPHLQTVRIVIMTSAGQRGDALASQQAGIHAYLTKPVRKAQLYSCLVHLMGNRPESAPSQQPALITRHTLKEVKKSRAEKILVADDHVINQRLAVLLLEKLGYQAEVVTNGEEALEALKTHRYQLVLMDCQMPVLDGYEATKAIRRSESALKHIPIIAMTANAMKGDKEKCLEAGMNDYVPKPIVAEDLEAALSRWLRPCDSSADT